MTKNYILVIEVVEGNGDVIDWIEEWISTIRIVNNYHIDDVTIESFYQSFVSDNHL